MTTDKITLEDIYKARKIVRRYLPQTPLVHSPALCQKLGFDAHIKCENTLPTGAFKVRGGVNLISQLAERRHRGFHGKPLAVGGLRRVPLWR
jgi:threonine dehydratase